MSLKLIETNEGTTKFFVPKESFRNPFAAAVFYNPAMEFSRTISAIAIGSALDVLGIEKACVVDGLCSLGARGIRYVCENKGIGRIFFVDANPTAIKVLKRNIALNKLQRKSKVVQGDLNSFLASVKQEFEVIEIDPFGSPAPFLENAVRRLEKKAILSVTATDLAALCGVHSRPCLRHYAAKPLRCEYSHELALRILLGAVARSAARFERGVKPLISWYERHYVKVVVLVEDGAQKADDSIYKLGFVNHCFKCFHRAAGELPVIKCPKCGAAMDYAGPLWMHETCDSSFLDKMSAEASRKPNLEPQVLQLLTLLKEEQKLPQTFFDLHSIASKLKLKQIPPLSQVLDVLKGKGFSAAQTHFNPNAIKTNASVKELLSIIKNYNPQGFKLNPTLFLDRNEKTSRLQSKNEGPTFKRKASRTLDRTWPKSFKHRGIDSDPA